MNAALRILSLALLGVCASARAELLVVERAPSDHAATERLRELHDEELRVVDTIDDPSARVVVFDGARVTVIAGGEQLTRSADTPYTAAFVAADMLALRPEPPPRHRVGLRVGPQLWYGAPFPIAARVELGVALVHDAWRIELYGAVPGRSSHAGIERTRSDLGLRGGLSLFVQERFELAAIAQVSAAWVRARFEQPIGARNVFSAGVGLEPRVRITPWLATYALATVQLSTGRAGYRIAGEEVARESPLGLTVGLGLWVTPPFR